MSSNFITSTDKALGEFIQYLDDANFYGAVLSVETMFFYGESGIFNKAVKFFREYDSGLVVRKQPMTLTFSSGAVIAFTSVERTRGMHLSTAMILNTPKLTSRDVQWVRTRLRRPCIDMGKYWFLDINDV